DAGVPAFPSIFGLLFLTGLAGFALFLLGAHLFLARGDWTRVDALIDFGQGSVKFGKRIHAAPIDGVKNFYARSSLPIACERIEGSAKRSGPPGVQRAEVSSLSRKRGLVKAANHPTGAVTCPPPPSTSNC